MLAVVASCDILFLLLGLIIFTEPTRRHSAEDYMHALFALDYQMYQHNWLGLIDRLTTMTTLT